MYAEILLNELYIVVLEQPKYALRLVLVSLVGNDLPSLI